MLAITFNGQSYSIPTAGEANWADSLNAYLKALAVSVVPSQAAPSVLMFGNQSSAGSDTAGKYLQPGFLNTFPGSTLVAIPVPFAGKVSNLRIHLAGSWASSAGHGTFTVLKNGSAQTVTCQLNHGDQDASDATHSFTVAAGDTIAIQLDTAGSTTAAMSFITATLELTLA